MKNTMRQTHSVACCLLILAYGSTDITLAASSRIRTPVTFMSADEQTVAKQHNNPTHLTYAYMAVPTDWYKTLVENENFMKWQDMARYFWEQQTGEQRLINTNQRRFSKRQPRPLVYPSTVHSVN